LDGSGSPGPARPPAGAPRVKVVYIAGATRSGSTVLGNLLGELEGFVSVGELRQLWQRGLIERRGCGCGVPVDECPFWAAVLAEGFGPAGSRMVRPRDVVDWQRRAVRLRHLRRARRDTAGDAPPARQAYASVQARLYEAIAAVTGSRVIVDSSKAPSGAASLRLAPGVDPRVVHLIRDPRAVAYSWRRRAGRRPPGEMARYGAVRAATSWAAANAGVEWVRGASGGGRGLRIRYEDMVRDPGTALRAIAELAGEPTGELPLSGSGRARLRPNHTVSGNPSRFETGEIELRDDAEWMDALPWAERSVVTAMTLPWLLRYGYPLRPGAVRAASSAASR
jgi:hypothetical protein